MKDDNIIEYPHCKECGEYFSCKRKGRTRYVPKFIEKTSCRWDCAYDKRCDWWGTPYDCPEFREWCYEDMVVAKEFNMGGCYRESKIESWTKQIMNIGEELWKKLTKN